MFITPALLILTALAGETSVAALNPATERDSDSWHYRFEGTIRYHLFGYDPSWIPSTDGPELYDASKIASNSTEWRGRVMLGSRFFDLELEPYTNLPAFGAGVRYAGLEVNGRVSLTDFFRVGAYHHSQHNFWDGRFGKGLNLNAFTADLALQQYNFVFREKPGHSVLRVIGYWFFATEGSPYVLTEKAKVQPSDIGSTRWRIDVNYAMRHPWGSVDCVNEIRSEAILPASSRGQCSTGLAVGRSLFGVWSEHILIGPFVGYGFNFQRQNDFGTYDASLGFVVKIRAADTTFGDRPAW